MRILILGGTRFLGRQVAEILALAGHDMTLLSRRSAYVPKGVRFICMDRASGLATLQGIRFHLVLDFICYDKTCLEQLALIIPPERYVMISSTWVPRLWAGNRADEISCSTILASALVPDATKTYLMGKLCAEQELSILRQTGCIAVSLRLPIMLGDGDHTGRLDFYRHRLTDGGPVIMVNGGQNLAQIAVMENLAQAIVRWITEKNIVRFPVWEALPDEGRTVQAIIQMVAQRLCTSPPMVDVPSRELVTALPEYLESEPFWRESALAKSPANIYDSLGILPAVFGKDITTSSLGADPQPDLRSKELYFLANRQAT